MREYSIHSVYTDASGSDVRLKDPNNIAYYLKELKLLAEYSAKTGITDIYALGRLAEIPREIIDEINEVKKIYEKCLLRNNKTKVKTI